MARAAAEGQGTGGGTRPKTPKPNEGGTRGKSGSGSWKALVAGLAVLAGVGGAALLGIGGGSDSLTQQEVQQRQANYDAFVAVGPMQFNYVSDAELDQAVEAMDIKAEEKEQLLEQVSQGEVRLAWITIRDTHAEDGDIVRLEGEGSLWIDVLALNTPTTVAFPMPSTGVINVTGMVDGGGGITVEMKSGSTYVAMPSMQPGQKVGIPVTAVP